MGIVWGRALKIQIRETLACGVMRMCIKQRACFRGGQAGQMVRCCGHLLACVEGYNHPFPGGKARLRGARSRDQFHELFLLLSPKTGDRVTRTRHPNLTDSQLYLACSWHVPITCFESIPNDMVVTRVIPKLQASNQSHVTLHASVARVQRARAAATSRRSFVNRFVLIFILISIVSRRHK